MLRKASFYIFAVIAVSVIFGCTPDEYDPPSSDRTETGEEGDDDTNDTIGDTNDTVIIGENLLLNGGLEEWEDTLLVQYDIPKYWLHHNNNNVRKNDVIVTEGTYSAKMESLETGSTARVDQRVAVTPGSRIRIRFSYYVAQWKSKGARTYCYFRTAAAEAYNISAAELKEFYGQDAYYIIRGGGYGLTYLPHDLNVWQTFDETIEVPPTAHYFVFGVNSYHGTTIYVDDCYVIEASE